MPENNELSMVDFAGMATQVRALKPRALTPEQFPDVVLCLEWMHGEILQQLAELDARREKLDQREAVVAEREHQAAIRGRVFGAAQAMKLPRRSVSGFVRGYLGK
jgi:hypothetical protein